jgi:peptidoglycan/xylan/chitin deacetylase (PgdA/CDA1 family)
VLRSIDSCGANRLARTFRRQRIVVLCYHAVVSDRLPSHFCRTRVAVTESQFAEQLRALVKYFHPISPDQVAGAVEEGSLPPRAVLVTFDDGFRNNLTHAVPILEEYRVPAIFHVSTGYIDRRNLLWPDEVNERVLHWPRRNIPFPGQREAMEVPRDEHAKAQLADRIREACKAISDEARQGFLSELREEPLPAAAEEWGELYEFLRWDDVREMVRRGFAIGSHTVTHPVLTRISPQALEVELTESKRTIEREVGTPCDWLAYPNGGPRDWSPSVTSAAATAGYRVGFTLMGRGNRQPLSPLCVDRVCIVRDMTVNAFQAALSGWAELYHRFIA